MAGVPPGCQRSKPHGGEPAIDVEVFAGDERAGSAGEEQDRGSNQLVRFAKALHRRAAHDVVDPLLVEDFAVLLGGKEAGTEDIDADVFCRVFAGEVLREVDDGGFRG